MWDPSHNRVEDLEASLKEAQESLQITCLENITLTKEFDKVVDEDLASMYDYFENALQQVEHFYPPLSVSREWVFPDQTIEDGKVVSLKDQYAISFFVVYARFIWTSRSEYNNTYM